MQLIISLRSLQQGQRSGEGVSKGKSQLKEELAALWTSAVTRLLSRMAGLYALKRCYHFFLQTLLES
jgi:hypothetical protein